MLNTRPRQEFMRLARKIISVLWLSVVAISPAERHWLDIQAAESKEVQAEKEQFYSARKDVDKGPVVKSKPEPEYTDEARRRGIQGRVVLRCVFASTGEVKYFHVISGLPYGLTEAAIGAGKRIKFKPAMKDGKPVSYWMELQYNFSL